MTLVSARLPGTSMRHRHWRSYVLALLVLGLGIGIRIGFDDLVGTRVIYLPFVVAVVVASWYGGMGPSVLVMLGSILFQTIRETGPGRFDPATFPAELVGGALFGFASLAIILINESRQAAHREVAQSVEELSRKSDQLQEEVQLRRDIEVHLRRSQSELLEQAEALAGAQRRTAESLAQLDALIRNAPVGLAFFDPEQRFVRINQALADFNGKPMADHLGRTLGEMLPAHAEEVQGFIQQVFRTGRPVLDRLLEVHDQAAPESARSWLASYFPVHVDDDSAVLGVGAIIQDVTERILVQTRLRESERRFRTLAEAVPQIVWVTLPDGAVEYFNQRWYDYTGLGTEDSLGTRWVDVLHPEDRPRTLEHWRRCVEEGAVYEVEYRFRGVDGSYRWYLARGVPVRAITGEVIRWFGTCTDIHDFKVAQENLRRSEERFRGLSESVPQMVWTAAPSGQVEYYNAQWYAYTGLTHAETRDAGWVQVLHPEDREAGVLAWQEALRRGDHHEVEQRLRRYDGAYRWHLVRGVPLRDDAGRIIQWVGTITDIDDKRRQAEILERQVRDRTEALERSNRELEQFAYVASHDLQEPLRKIQAFGDRLDTRFREPLGDQGREYLERILSSASRMRSLINDLLSFSRVTTKSLPFRRVDLNVVAREVLVDLEELVHQTGGTVNLGPLPTLEADPLQMRQLLQNLLGNALKFSKPGDPPVVRIESRELAPGEAPGQGTWFEVRVSDNGIGFDQEYAQRIFQVFQRLHGRQQYEGTGVGLAICKKIVERHRGTIAATSRKDEGTTFVLTLPLEQQSPDF